MRLLAFAALAGLAASASAQTRLVQQSVQGWQRICTYEDMRPVRTARGEPRRYTAAVGRGEPCPPRYAAPQREPATRPARRPAELAEPGARS